LKLLHYWVGVRKGVTLESVKKTCTTYGIQVLFHGIWRRKNSDEQPLFIWKWLLKWRKRRHLSLLVVVA